MQHSGTKVLETPRLILRPFTLDDAPAMYANWGSDPNVTTFLSWPTHNSIADSETILADWVSHYSEPDYYVWAIVPQSVDEPIGGISVVKKDDGIEMVHIGYCIGQKWWHQGITSEALRELIRFFFEEVGVNRIEAIFDPFNPNSGKVMARCGMLQEGTMRQAGRNNQGICDYTMYGILKCDYFASKA